MRQKRLFILLLVELLWRQCRGLQQAPNPTTSRRQVFSKIIAGTTAVVPLLGANAETPRADRNDLLNAIARKASDDEVIRTIRQLKDPSNGRGASDPKLLDGQWELIWSYKADAFSPLLKLPKPLRPDSYQYFGDAAASEVGEGRLAQGLTSGVLGTKQVWLSSGAKSLDSDQSILEILPPFRFELGGRYGTQAPKKLIVEAGNDADFRRVNARSREAQLAGKNQYQQLYVEKDGPGALRVSSVIAGDPVIVGAIFVHRKL